MTWVVTPSAAAAPWTEYEPSGHCGGVAPIGLSLTAGSPHRFRNTPTFSEVKGRWRAGGDDTFLIQYRGDLLIHQALSVELYNAVTKIVEIGVVVVVAVNAPQHSVFAHSACLPDDLDPYLTP